MTPYIITGKVVEGNHIGRRLGFPTANIHIGDDVKAVDGVYAARITVGRMIFGAMANLGRRPSVSTSGERILEVHLFDFSNDLYDKTISVELLDFIRPEHKFPTKEALKVQVDIDRAKIIELLKDKII